MSSSMRCYACVPCGAGCLYLCLAVALFKALNSTIHCLDLKNILRAMQAFTSSKWCVHKAAVLECLGANYKASALHGSLLMV